MLPLAVVLGLLSSCPVAPQACVSAFHFGSEGRAVVPFELTKGVVFFQIHVKGSSRTLWFSLDSGAGSSYMDAGVAKSLGLQTVGSGTVQGAGSGDVPVEYVDSVTFELPGLESARHRINVTDFKGLNEQFGRTEDGLLGYDFLSRYVVVVDYAEQKMTVYDPLHFRYTGSGVALPVQFRHRWPYISGTIKVQGLDAQSGEFLVDSGSGDAVDHPAIMKSTGPLRKIQTGVGLGAPGQGKLGRAEYLELGHYRLLAPIISCCSPNPDDEQKVGGEVLRRFTVIFDYPHDRIIFEPNRNFPEPFPDA
jgi:hypothetical protein